MQVGWVKAFSEACSFIGTIILAQVCLGARGEVRLSRFSCRTVPVEAPKFVAPMPELDHKRRRRVPKPAAAPSAAAFVDPLPTAAYWRFIDLLLRRWWVLRCAAYLDAKHRALWAHAICLQSCLLALLEAIATGAVRMQNIFAGAWDGLWHTPGRQLSFANAPLWIMSVLTSAAPLDFGVKKATVQSAVKWLNPLTETLYARAQHPTEHQSTRPQLGITWIQPLCGLVPIRRYRHGGVWFPLPPIWEANPHWRLVILEALVAEVGHAVGVAYMGGL